MDEQQENQFLQSVKALHEKKMSQRDIADELKVSRSQVQTALQKLKLTDQTKGMVSEKKLREIIREELKNARKSAEEEEKSNAEADGRFPVVRKMGGGVETIAPEAVLKQYMGGTPEGESELRAIMKFRAAMLMVMDLVNIQKESAEADARRMEPILKLMQETRMEQDAAAQRAKESNAEIADRAAQNVAGQLFGAVNQNNAQVTGSLDQIKQLLSGKSDDPFSRILSMFQSMQQMAQMFGMPMPGMLPAGGQPGPQPTTAAPPIEKHSIKELEGK